MTTEKLLIAYDPITFESFIRHATKHIDPYYDPYGEGFTDAVESIVGWMECNTVDAVEVVHGEWVVCGDGEYVPFMCSACGKTTSWYHKQTANYCPNCGAKMDGDGNA